DLRRDIGVPVPVPPGPESQFDQVVVPKGPALDLPLDILVQFPNGTVIGVPQDIDDILGLVQGGGLFGIDQGSKPKLLQGHIDIVDLVSFDQGTQFGYDVQDRRGIKLGGVGRQYDPRTETGKFFGDLVPIFVAVDQFKIILDGQGITVLLQFGKGGILDGVVEHHLP